MTSSFDRLIDKDGFFMKGRYLLGVKKYLEKNHQEDVFDKVIQNHGHKSISPLSQVPLLTTFAILDEIAFSLNMERDWMLEEVTRLALEIDLNGVLKLFMRASGTENILKRIPQISRTYTEYFDVEVLENSKGTSKVRFVLLDEFKVYLQPGLKGAAIGICNVCKTPVKEYFLSDERNLSHKGQQLIEFTSNTIY